MALVSHDPEVEVFCSTVAYTVLQLRCWATKHGVHDAKVTIRTSRTGRRAIMARNDSLLLRVSVDWVIEGAGLYAKVSVNY